MRLVKLVLILFPALIFSGSNTSVTGDVSYYYMQRLDDNSVVNIPFRMLNLNVLHQRDNFDVGGTFSLEYRNRKDVDFMIDSDPTDFNTILRELY